MLMLENVNLLSKVGCFVSMDEDGFGDVDGGESEKKETGRGLPFYVCWRLHVLKVEASASFGQRHTSSTTSPNRSCDSDM